MSRQLCLSSRLLPIIAFVCIGSAIVSTESPRFYPDDPIARAPESQDASSAKKYEIESLYEMTRNLFITARYKPSGTRAKDINTIDEVPDSSWFTNRIGVRPMTVDEIARGPIDGPPPDPSHWVITHQKTAGVHPGFTARDAKGETWFLEFDPRTNPEGATGAVEVATKLFWALGYNQVESFLTTFDPRLATIDPKATVRRPSGAHTPFKWDDVKKVLEQAARNQDGTYRVSAGRLIRGKILGDFMYDGTRPDDPNDLVPHEHRRELRGLRVFAAWTNLTDLKASNTLDTLVTENGHSIVKHYLQDVGSTFGMCNDVHEWDLSYEYFYDLQPTRRRLFSFGFALSPWQRISYVEYPSIGKFEGDRFDPRAWRPQTPTTAYMEMRDDDAFWAARKVMAFSDELIRAAVHTGQFSDPEAERHLADVLIERRNTIGRVYLSAINPIVDPRLDERGRLTFANAAFANAAVANAAVANAAVAAGGAAAASGAHDAVMYDATWMRFDNVTGQTSPLAETRSAAPAFDAPSGLPTSPDSYVEIDLSAAAEGHPTWMRPIRTWFKRDASGWTLVGLERLPDDHTERLSASSSSSNATPRFFGHSLAKP